MKSFFEKGLIATEACHRYIKLKNPYASEYMVCHTGFYVPSLTGQAFYRKMDMEGLTDPECVMVLTINGVTKFIVYTHSVGPCDEFFPLIIPERSSSKWCIVSHLEGITCETNSDYISSYMGTYFLVGNKMTILKDGEDMEVPDPSTIKAIDPYGNDYAVNIDTDKIYTIRNDEFTVNVDGNDVPIQCV